MNVRQCKVIEAHTPDAEVMRVTWFSDTVYGGGGTEKMAAWYTSV